MSNSTAHPFGSEPFHSLVPPFEEVLKFCAMKTWVDFKVIVKNKLHISAHSKQYIQIGIALINQIKSVSQICNDIIKWNGSRHINLHMQYMQYKTIRL